MPDLGQPSSYLTLEKGQDVYSSDEEKVGVIEHVLSEPELDLFDGVVLDTSVLPGGHRFVDADQVDEVYEQGMVLKVDRAGAEALPEPSENAAAMEADPSDSSDSELSRKLRRAWDVLSGNT